MTFAASVSYLDVIVLAIVAIFGLAGLKKGFMLSLISIFSGIVTLVIAYFLAKPVANWLASLELVQTWVFADTNSLKATLGGLIPAELAAVELGDKVQIVGSIALTKFSMMAKTLGELIVNAKLDATVYPTVGAALSQVLANLAYTIIVGILLFIIMRIIFGSVKRALENRRNERGVSGLNRFLGFALGIVKGAAIMVALLTAIFLFQGKNFVSPIIQEIDKSVVTKPIYTMVDDIATKAMESEEPNWLGNALNSIRAIAGGTKEDQAEQTYAQKYARFVEEGYEVVAEDVADLTAAIAEYDALSDEEKAELPDNFKATLEAYKVAAEALVVDEEEGGITE